MKEENEEFYEKPKAVVEMEENSDTGKAKKRIKEKKEQNIKQANKKFFIKYAVFLIVMLLITAGAIYFSIKQNKKEPEQEKKEEIIDTSKPESTDKKYGINAYDETYNENAITIKRYAGNDQLVEETYGAGEYVQIEGLLDKDLQSSINKRLKETAKNLKEGNRRTFSNVTANFSNILSVDIFNEDNKRESINIDLSTGEDIPLESVFVSSAPLNSLIMEGTYKRLAWDKLESNYETLMGTLDMNKVDTTQYEDTAMQVINNYKAKGKDLKFYITNTGITIFGLTDPSMFISDNKNPGIDIEFLEHREDIAIYKRYLTQKSIYENDSLGQKGLIVFTNNIYDNKYSYNLAYGKEGNVFIEEAFFFYADDATKNQKLYGEIKKYFENIANEDKQRIENETESDKGAFYQKEINVSKVTAEGLEFYGATINEYQATCDKEYFKDEAFKDYIKMSTGPRADIGLNGFDPYFKDEYPNLNISDKKQSTAYFDNDGNFIGNTQEEAISKLKQNQPPANEPIPENQNIPANESNTSNEQTDVNITNTNTNESTVVVVNSTNGAGTTTQ